MIAVLRHWFGTVTEQVGNPQVRNDMESTGKEVASSHTTECLLRGEFCGFLCFAHALSFLCMPSALARFTERSLTPEAHREPPHREFSASSQTATGRRCGAAIR